MCGIAGYLGKRTLDRRIIRRTLDLMKNRGPDNQECLTIDKDDFNVFLFHSRLAIIDLDGRSNQPFSIEGYSIIFNGEIYNYIELRHKLLKLGHSFVTNSDTEVLIKAYIEYGEDCVKYFNGMWAFAIWDDRLNRIFISRDRFGEKPLYYYLGKGGIYFGSEVKFIRSLINEALTINYEYLSRYLVYGYKFLNNNDNNTYFKKIIKLENSTNLIYENNNLRKEKYWFPKIKEDSNMSFDEAVEGSKHYLLESMRLRLQSDVPIAFCLSGGVDSSSLASISKFCFNHDVVTFSIIDEDKRYNELDNIKATIKDLNCNHFLINLNYTNMISRLKNLIHYHDAPISTISYLIHSMLSEKINENGFKVSISGTSADEIFTGYYDHFNLYFYDTKNNQSLKDNLKIWEKYILPYIRNPYLKNPKLYFKNQKIRKHIHLNSEVFLRFLKDHYSFINNEVNYTKSLLRNRMLNELMHEITPVILHEDDLNSMMYSIENRSPFLDVNLVEFSHSIPTKHFIRKGYSKYILRKSVKNILNEKVRLDRKKVGFNASIHSVFNFDDKIFLDYIFADSPIFEIIKKEKVKSLIKKNNFKNSESKFIFNFINSKIFLESF